MSEANVNTTVTPETANEASATTTPEVSANVALQSFLEKFGGGDPENLEKLAELGVETVADLADLSAEELRDSGLKLVQARKLLKEIGGQKTEPVASAPALQTQVAPLSMDILPVIPDEGSWLTSLKTGGVLRVNDATYIGAIRAAMAHRCGLYDVPEKLLKMLEEHAEELDEPVGDDYYKTRKMITRRNYAEIFEAIDGIDGPFATTKERRTKFLKNLDQIFWPAIKSAYDALDAWYDSMINSASSPAALMNLIAGQQAGLGLPAITPPPHDMITSACDDLKDEINKVFRGTAIPVSAALAYDAKKINEVLSEPTMPAQIGAGNRDQMLRMLGLNINSSYTRQEQIIVRFVLSFIKFNDAGVGNEIPYLGALWQLGRQIAWDTLGFTSSAKRTGSIGDSTYL